MSTRVDKGGPKFRPIIKSKPRPSATPAPDVRARSSAEPSAAMPPPSIIPARTPSVAPSTVPAIAVPSDGFVSGRSALPAAPQVPSKPKAAGTTIILPSARSVTIKPTQSPSSTPRRVIPIASTSSVVRSSHGVPITMSTPHPTSIPAPAEVSAPVPSLASVPSSSKGKNRVAPETGEETTDDERPEPDVPGDTRGGVARKRPKLTIVQAEEGRVKKPARAVKAKTKTKEKAAASGAEAGTTGGDEESAGPAEVSKTKRAPKKKTASENSGGDVATNPSRPKRARTKRKQAQEDEDTNSTVPPQDPQLPPESSPPSAPARKKRKQSETVEPEGTPEPIDPTQVTMSTICDDLGSGRVSSRWETSQAQYEEARKRAREERARAIAEAAEEERETGRVGTRKGSARPTLPTDDNAAAGEESVVANTNEDPDEFTYDESLKASHYAPQVRIGANGEIVLDVESLQVDRAADAEIAEDSYGFVEESDQSRFTNSNSWSKRRSVRWGKEDTAMFYYALRQFGQNFDLIARVLPGRTYRMCRNKFKAEDKKNPGLIDDALKNSVAVDISTLSRMTGKDFSGPTPVIVATKGLDLGENEAQAERAAPDQVEAFAKENQTPISQSSAKKKGRKNAVQEEGVEVLGLAEDHVDDDID